MDRTTEARRTACGAAIPTEQDRAAVRRLLDELGDRGASAQTGVSVATLNRIGAGSPVRRAGLIAVRVAAGLPVHEGGS